MRSGNLDQTSLNYAGLRLDGTGLLYAQARYYDPVTARFVSADSVVPGGPGGDMAGVALMPLTADFHEVGLVVGLGAENRAGGDERRQLHWGGPVNPQSLNRYAYVLNNPLRYTDPTGHYIEMTRDEAADFVAYVLSPLITALAEGNNAAVDAAIDAGLGMFGAVSMITGMVAAVIGFLRDGQAAVSSADLEVLSRLRDLLMEFHDATGDNPDTLVRVGLLVNMYKARACSEGCRAWDTSLYVEWAEDPTRKSGAAMPISKGLYHRLYGLTGPPQYVRHTCFYTARLMCSHHSTIADQKKLPEHTSWVVNIEELWNY